MNILCKTETQTAKRKSDPSPDPQLQREHERYAKEGTTDDVVGFELIGMASSLSGSDGGCKFMAHPPTAATLLQLLGCASRRIQRQASRGLGLGLGLGLGGEGYFPPHMHARQGCQACGLMRLGGTCVGEPASCKAK